MASDIVITPSRGSTTVNAKIDFTGASTASSQIRLEVLPDNSLSFVGTTGSLFSIADSVTGSLMSVNDASGLPILEVFDTDKVVMGQYNQNTLVVNGTNTGVGTGTPTAKLHVAYATAQTSVDGTAQLLTLENAATTDASGNLAGIRFRQTNSANSANGFVGMASTGSNTTRGSLVFAPPNTSGNATEKMRLTVYGTFLVGDTVEINSSWWNNGIGIFGKNGTDKLVVGYLASTTTGALVAAHNSALNAWAPLNINGSTLNFRIGETSRMFIDASGNITTGVWNATVINSTYGGTGVNNGGRTLTLNTNSGTITFSSASTTLTVANNASVSGTNTGDQTTVSGNAGTATTLQTARNLTINGTAKSFNGSADISWTAAEIGLTSYLPLTGGTISSNLAITGNLTVNGTTTTVNSTTVTIDDPIFTLGGDTAPASDDNKDRGIEFRWHNGTAAKVGFFGYDDSTGYFTFIPDSTNTSEVFSGTQGDIQAANFRGNHVGNVTGDITGSLLHVDGPRNLSNRNPNWAARRSVFDFVTSATVGTGGNYAGVLTFVPWEGTTASTGDASYQLAFGSTAANGGGNPQLRIRKGIDTTWNSWVDILTSVNYGAYSTFSGIVTSTSGGFQTATYTSNARNRIWSFGNADTYGLSYFQGTAGFAGGAIDTIGLHFGTATAAGSSFRFSQDGTFNSSGAITQAGNQVLHAGNYTTYVGNGTLTLAVSGTGLSGSASFTANQSGNTTFTVTSNATSANTASAIVARDVNGDFQARNITSQDDYTNGWFRNNNSNTGLYNQSTYLHLSSQGANTSYLDISTVGSSQSGIRFYTGGHVNTLRGYIVANTSNELMLWNSGGSYSARFTSSVSEIYQDTYVPTLYANIMYDRNDTGYYNNPASTSVFNRLEVAGYPVRSSATIDMSNTATYATTNFYPVTIPLVYGMPTRMRIVNTLNSNVPSWSTHAGGFTCHVEWTSNGSGWGTIAVQRSIHRYTEGYTSSVICGGITQMTNSSIEVIWLRGGGRYYFEADAQVTPTAQSTTYTLNSQSVTPSSSAQNDVLSAAVDTRPSFQRLNLTQSTGTAPLTVTSTTLVTNLNADLVDGLHVHTGTNNVANQIVRTDANGYIQAGWINTISGDNGTTAIDRVYASSDAYIRTYTPANFRTVLNVPTRTGGDASGTWGVSVTGNAGTATTLQTARTIAGVSFNGSANISITGQNITNSSGTASNDIEVAKYLRWKNYGNNHILIDASAGTNPAGGAIDKYTPANTINSTGAGVTTWGEAISLMGWNGSATYGVRVDRARSIDNQANSATTTAASANTANQIVLRDASGNFSAGTITATLTGTASALVTGNNYQVNSLGVGTAASATAGEIRATNNITAYYSDERLKTRLGAIENPIEKVKSLSGFYFSPNDTAMALGYKKTIDVGVSAQEVNAILPEIIAPAPIDERYMTVRYEKLIPLLIEAIKEQQKQIEELKSLLNK